MDKFIWELEVEEGSRFSDPLTLELSVFFPNRLSLLRPSEKHLKESLNFYLNFPFYARGSGVAYVNKLVDKILLVKPFQEAVQVAQDLKAYREQP